MNKIEVVNLSHFYQDGMQMKKVLDNISCSFESGKFYSILGQSGSGKTTLLSLLSGLDTIEEGDILYNGESIKKIGYNKYRNSYVNIIFQSYNLIPYMTAYENVEVALDIAGIKLSKEDKKEKILSTLNELGIDNSAAFRTVLKLSGGEQQRVAIARCLVTDIPFIMQMNLLVIWMKILKKRLIDIFKKLAKQGKGVIVVTHSKELAESSDKIYHIKGGGVY